MRILLVEDNELDRLAVRRCLYQAGIDAVVDEVWSAADAVQRFGSRTYDCVLLDYFIPGLDTISLLRSFAQQARDVPVVVLTGRGDENIAVEFMKAGAADYLPKASLDPERLVTSFRYAQEMSRNAAARREAEQALQAREAEFRALANAIPQLAWTADTQGRRYWYNQRWYEYTGLRPDESSGLGWHLALHPNHRAAVVANQAKSFGEGEVWEETVLLRRHDEEYRWFLARAMPVRDDEGTILRWVGTDTDITEHKVGALERERLLELEQTARAEAVRAVKARDDVVAIVAHDLRNPMQNITMSASVLTMVDDKDQRNRQVGIIQRSIAEMSHLISDLLDVARLESGTLPIKRAKVDVRTLVADALEQFAAQALARKIVLDNEISWDVPAVDADRDRMLQVLSNLLANALQFTPEGGAISVRAAKVYGGVQFCVQDTGTGISPENLPYIFDRFWQSTRSSRSGAGLGLAICKGIVEAHGGTIRATTAPGGGATIEFTLPQSLS